MIKKIFKTVGYLCFGAGFVALGINLFAPINCFGTSIMVILIGVLMLYVSTEIT